MNMQSEHAMVVLTLLVFPVSDIANKNRSEQADLLFLWLEPVILAAITSNLPWSAHLYNLSSFA